MRLKLRYIFFLAVPIIFVSCSVTRKLPDGDYMLIKNQIVINNDTEDKLSRQEKIKKNEVSAYLKQKPNSKLLGMKVNVQIYNLSNPDKNNRINRWIRKIGDPPVIYDSNLSVRTVDDISVYLRSRGYFNSSVDYITDTVGKKIYVDYRINTGTPYRIGNIKITFLDRFLEPIVMGDSINTLIRTGDLFDVSTLQAERERITDYLKNQGYHNFTINNISYIADSIPDEKIIDITMLVRQHTAGYDEDDRPITENNAVFRIRDIYVIPDYDASHAARDSNYFEKLDTLQYRGVSFLYDKTLNVKPEVLLRAINIYPNYLYNETDIRRAYDNLFNLNFFRNINIIMSEVQDSTSGNMITFIGDDFSDDGNYTLEKFLDYRIYATPRPRQSYSIDMEGTTTSNYYGLKLTIGYQHRNIFKGIELFDISTTGGYEFMRSRSSKNSFEIGSAVGFTMPRFITPFRVNRYNRLNNVKTRFELSVNYQDRPYYTRTLSSATAGYSWTNNKNSSFIIRPVDITLIKMHSVDQNFLDSIQNRFLRDSYTSQLLVGVSASYLYNNQVSGVNKNTFRMRVNAESKGNIIDLFALMARGKRNDNVYNLFGIQYAQYVRADIDASYKFVLGEITSLVYRFYAGSVIPYGNSRISDLPADRQFYAGGPNSMRGWQARTLGPGGTLEEADKTYSLQYGNLKLETNLEFRFPVWNFFHGALFTDIGNVWYTRRDGNDPLATFYFDTFYKQLGINGGVGVRLDFNFFIFRLDWGLRLRDPNKPKEFRWIKNLTLRQSTFNFGIGYPF
ncbi:MAG: BamA/TamA family outer membrane protein [Rikenellaceae bacterium]|nr:BamA/TamA family outer membrane protein [Rikenellaceae bacterium]